MESVVGMFEAPVAVFSLLGQGEFEGVVHAGVANFEGGEQVEDFKSVGVPHEGKAEFGPGGFGDFLGWWLCL